MVPRPAIFWLVLWDWDRVTGDVFSLKWRLFFSRNTVIQMGFIRSLLGCKSDFRDNIFWVIRFLQLFSGAVHTRFSASKRMRTEMKKRGSNRWNWKYVPDKQGTYNTSTCCIYFFIEFSMPALSSWLCCCYAAVEFSAENSFRLSKVLPC